VYHHRYNNVLLLIEELKGKFIFLDEYEDQSA